MEKEIDKNVEVEEVEEKQENSGSVDEKDKQSDEKTFTQKQVSRMMAREKKQGVNSVYNDLGINPDDKEAIENIKKYIASQKSDEQKSIEAKIADNKAIEEANRKATIAETKAEALQAGIQSQYVDDAVTLVLSKINNDESDVKTAISELKTKYPVWFTSTDDKDSKDGQRGTGSSIKGSKDGGKRGEINLGKRLAANKKTGSGKKSYWAR